MSSTFRPLTEVAQELVAAVVHSGELVIDATAGNGHDTLFLARLVGPSGHVIALDVQQEALNSTVDRLHTAGVQNVTLRLGSHSELATHVPENWQGRLAAAMFNLGYLPGGNKSITTQSASTLKALQTAMSWLRPDGVITLLIYTGHPAGQDELTTLLPVLMEPHSEYLVTEIDPQPQRLHPPRLFSIQRRPSEDVSN